jgi:hypothetical protein
MVPGPWNILSPDRRSPGDRPSSLQIANSCLGWVGRLYIRGVVWIVCGESDTCASFFAKGLSKGGRDRSSQSSFGLRRAWCLAGVCVCEASMETCQIGSDLFKGGATNCGENTKSFASLAKASRGQSRYLANPFIVKIEGRYTTAGKWEARFSV